MKGPILEEIKTKDAFIKDSNVEILISNGSTQNSGSNKKTDYLSLVIIVIIMFGLLAYYTAKKYGIV